MTWQWQWSESVVVCVVRCVASILCRRWLLFSVVVRVHFTSDTALVSSTGVQSNLVTGLIATAHLDVDCVNTTLHPPGVAKSSISFAGVTAGMSPLPDGKLHRVITYSMGVPVAVRRLSELLCTWYLTLLTFPAFVITRRPRAVNKKLCYCRRTARRDMSVKFLLTAA